MRITLLFMTLIIMNISSSGQNEKANASTIFDSLILTQPFEPVELKTHNINNDRRNRLVYNTDLILYNGGLKSILDSPMFSENEKIEFIRQALLDTNKDAFHFIDSYNIDFWRSSQEATNLIEEYFRNKKFENSTDIGIKYKYLQFKSYSLYPDSEQLIENYFKTRPRKKDRYSGEHRLILTLIKLKKEEKALKYLNLMLDDDLRSETSNFGLVEVIEVLCLSENPKISKDATDTLIKLLYKADYETYSLYKLIAFLDKSSYLDILNSRFEDIKNIDFSPFKGQNFDQVPVSFRRESIKFFRFLFSYSKDLGDKRGHEIWNLFTKTIEFWDSYGQPFEMSQLHILQNCLLDKKLSVSDRIKMISQAKFTEKMKNGQYAKQYLSILESIQPLDKFTTELSEQLHIAEIDTSNVESYQFDASNKMENLADLVELNNDLNNYAKANNLTEMHISRYQSFYYLDKKYSERLISDFFILNNRLIGIDYDTPDYTPDVYRSLTQNIQNILNFTLNEELKLIFNSHKHNEETHEYDFTIALKDKILKYQFKEEPRDWNPSRLIQILNINLIPLNYKERLISIAEEGTGGKIIYAKPDELKKLLNKYNIKSYAVEWNDKFSKE